MSSGYQPYADVYTQSYDRPSQDQAYNRGRSHAEPAALVRQGQWDQYTRAPARRNDDDGQTRRRYRGSSAPDGDYYYERNQRNNRGRNQDYSSSESRSRSSSRERDRRPRRSDKSQRGRRPQSQVDVAHRHYDGDYQSRVGRAFDASPNGVLAAAAGAGLGAITARRVGDKDHFTPGEGHGTWKTIGGAIAGGLAANAAENKWRKYSEDKERRSEARTQ